MQRGQRSRSPPVKKKSLGKVAVMNFFHVFSCVLFKLMILCGSILLLLRIFGISADVILSGSMEPALRTGGIAFTDTREFVPEEGDIITYRLNGLLITHRIVQKKKDTCITKGDANDGVDAEEVEISRIIGKVIFTVPFLGYVVVFLRTKTGIFVLLVLSVTGFIQNRK